MKFKLRKSDKSKQAVIRQTIQRGLPLASLLASAAFAAGCGENKTTAVAGGIRQAPGNRMYIDGDIAPIPVEPDEKPHPQLLNTPGVMPPPPREVQLPEKTEIYTVKSGDTLYRIAKDNRVPSEMLKVLNNFTDEQANKLTVGQKIIVPQKDNRNNERNTPLSTSGTPVPPESK